jgi:cytochrome c oxidase subunit 2
MEGVVDLHHDIMFLLIIISTFVLYLLIRVVVLFHEKKNNFVKIVHGKVIEVVWTIIPSLILAVIAVPSFALLYSMDEVVDPAITVKAIGHQWY